MCAHNVFLEKFYSFGSFIMFKSSKKSKFFFTPYSVEVGDFLPHTQYMSEIFYRILSRRRIFFTAYQQNGEYQPNTLHKWIFWFSPQVTYLDRNAQCE
jgi:hypothetical protein